MLLSDNAVNKQFKTVPLIQFLQAMSATTSNLRKGYGAVSCYSCNITWKSGSETKN
jgi:hypothetical protein